MTSTETDTESIEHLDEQWACDRKWTMRINGLPVTSPQTCSNQAEFLCDLHTSDHIWKPFRLCSSCLRSLQTTLGWCNTCRSLPAGSMIRNLVSL